MRNLPTPPFPARTSTPRKSLYEHVSPRRWRKTLNERPTQAAFPFLRLFVFLLLAAKLPAQVILSDGGVNLNAGSLYLGVGGDAQYIIGLNSAYNEYSTAGNLIIGHNSTNNNHFIVRNGSTVDFLNGKDVTFASDNNSITVTGAGSQLLVHYHASGIVSTGSGDSNNEVHVLDGGFFQMGDFNIGSNSTGNLVNVDGTDSIFQTRENIHIASGGELTLTASNGGLLYLPTLVNSGTLTATISDGGILHLRNTTNLSIFDSFTLESGSELISRGTLSNLGSITTGQTVDLYTDGSFGTATTLAGGTLQTEDFNYSGSNLTFTSGTHEATGALSNVPDIVSGMTVDISNGGSFANSTLLNGGTVSVSDFDFSTGKLTFTSGTLDVTGILSNYTSATNQILNLNVGGSWDAGDNPTFNGDVNLTGGTLTVVSFDASELSTFTSGTLAVSGALSNLAEITAGMTVEMGATGSFATATTLNGGTVSLDDFDFNGSPLTFTSGSVISTGALSNLPTVSAGVTVDISGGGSLATATTLDGGMVATGTFDYTGGNLTFTSGTHQASGALSNLPTIGANMTVDISGGGSFATATTLDGGTAAVGDFNLATDNLNFTSGTLDTSGTLTVGSDDGSATLSGTISGTGGVTKSGTGTITLSGTNTYSGDTTVSGGSLTAGATDTFSPDSAITLADTSGATLDLNDFDQTISGLSGGGATGGNVDLGSATLTIDSDADATAFAGVISGTGSLANTGSGTTTLAGANTYTGGTTVSAGTLAIDTTGSIAHADSNLVVGNVDGSSAVLTIASGGTVTNDFGYLGIAAGSTGNATVEGTWNNDSLRVGYNGDGHLTIEDGGLVANSASFVGYFDGSDSSVTVRGGSMTNSGYLRVGYGGEGTVTVADGGSISAGGSLAVTVADQSGSTGTLNIGEGGAAGIVDAPFLNGGDGTATVNFNHTDSDYHLTTDGTSGGTAVNLTGSLAVNHIGTGTTTLDGTNTYTGGTTITAGTLVGDADALPGSITVNGGTLSVLDAYDAANLTLTSGSLIAAGALSNLADIASGATVDLSGGGSFATATTLNGGTLATADFDFSSGNLTFTSGTLNLSGTLSNYTSVANQTLNLNSGGAWDAGNNPTFNGSVNLSGGSLDVQAFDATQLNAFTSGTLNVTGTLTNYTSAASQTLNLNTGGLWDAGDAPTFNGDVNLAGGTLEVQAFDASQLAAFTSGTLSASGALTNLNDLGSGRTVVIDGGSWSPTGDINAAGVTVQGGGSLTVDAYDGTNLTFTNGTLNASGSLTNLPTLVANNTVDLTSGGSLGDATTLDGGTLQVGGFDGSNLTTTSGTITATGALTNLPTISTDVTVDITSGGSFGDATTLDGGTVSTGAFDYSGSNLTFTSGTLEASGALSNVPTIASGMTVDISNGGSLVTATTLDGGTLSTGAHDYSSGNITFTSGTHQLAGALTNLNTLAANQGIVLDGSSAIWSPTGDIDAGSVTLQNNAKLNVADYDASNLTFTNGDLTVTGTLTGLDALTNTNQDVILDGGTWTTTGDLDFGSNPSLGNNVTLKNGGVLSLQDYTGITADGSLTGSGGGTLMVSGTLTEGGFPFFRDPDLTIDLTPGGQIESLFGYTYIQSGNFIINDGALGQGDGEFYFDTDSNGASLTVKGTLSGTLRSESTMTLVLDGGSHTTTSTNINNLASVVVQNDGFLSVAAYDADNVTFTNGTLTATGILTNLPTIASDNTIDISGGGSFGDATTLDGGTVVADAFNMSGGNLTFTSGTLEVGGALTNLDSLVSGQAVVINGASATWSPTGNIDAGTVTLTEGAITLSTAFDASNFTFDTAHGGGPVIGTLTMSTGALTNLNTLPLSAEVVLNGDSSWAPSGDVSAGSVTLDSANAALSINGDFDSRFITFNAGTLTTNGTITELNSLSANQAVVLDGASAAWSPTGDITGGSTSIFNDGALTTDNDLTVGTNLIFTHGTLTTSGDIEGLNTLTANHTIVMNGGTWSPTGNIDAGTVNLTEGSLTLNTSFDASNLTFASTFSEPVALLTMNSGTLTNLNTLQVGRRVPLNGSSSWAPTGDIEAGETVLNSANASLTTTGDLDTRAVVFNAGTLAGDGVLSELPTIGTNMTVDLSSGGSLGTATTLDGGDLITADLDASLLTATSGDLTASGAVSNLGTIGTNLDVDLTGGGSLTTATSLSGGSLRIADFDATQLSLSSGTLLATGDVSNLADIGSNLLVLMSSSAAFDTATTLDGGTVAISGSPGIYDFSANNLTFTSGTVSFFEINVANMPDITSGQIVELESTDFTTSTNLNGGELILSGENDFNDLNLTFTSGTLTLGFEGELANLPAITANQTVDITDGGFITTTFLAGGTLITDNFNEDDDVLFAFGTLQVYGAVHDLGSIISGQTVDISNGGSIEDLTTLNGGTLLVDDIDFDDDPVIFNAGTVVALGNVYLEDDLESGMILDITAGGELGGGTDIIGGTLKTVDFDADGPSPTDFYEGTLSVTGELTGLHGLYGPGEGDGQSVILDGGTWSPDRGESDSDYINDGNVTIQNDGLLIVNGNYDATNLTFTNGTLTLTNEAELENLNDLGAGQTVVLDDAFWMAEGDINAGNIEITSGSFLIANGGGGASTEFDATNLTFTSGGLAVEDQNLVNLNTVGANQSVYLDNGSWSPTGSIDNADEIGLYNNASLTVGDYDASNLDFDSGTVTTTGSLTNLDTLGANNAVVIDGGEWLPTGGDISAGSVTVENDGLLGVGTDFSTGTYDATNLTLTSGTLSTNHDITNLDTLGAGATVELFAEADWSPAGNIEAGTVKLNGGTLNVGDYDATNLPLSFDGGDAGGTLVTTGALTNLDGLTSTLSVTVDGGTWNTTGDIDAGSVTVQNDGNLGVADLDASNLTLTAGTVTATGALTHLNTLSSTDQTIVLDGGTWSPTGNVSPGNVTVQNNATLTVGDYDATRLTLSNGTVASDGSLTNLPTIGSDTTIDITLGGTIDSATTLDRGTINATELDATHVTFVSGTINVAGGPLTNLDTLGANQAVTLDNASWSATGDIDGGNVTLTNNASLTVADYDTANLTFTSGTVEATGTLTHDQQLAANQTVRLNGGSATYDVGIDLQLSAGTIELANGGTLDVGSHTATVLDADTISFETGGGAIALDGGTLNLASLDTAFSLGSNGEVTGNGRIFGDVGLGTGGLIDGDATGLEIFGNVNGTGTLADLTLHGTLDIGNSPGQINLQGVTLGDGSLITMSIEGTDAGQFDTLIGDAFTDVSAGSLSISFTFTPEASNTWQLITGDMDPLSFGSISTPTGWALNSSGMLSAVPEPSTYAMIFGGLALAFAAHRRRRLNSDARR